MSQHKYLHLIFNVIFVRVHSHGRSGNPKWGIRSGNPTGMSHTNLLNPDKIDTTSMQRNES